MENYDLQTLVKLLINSAGMERTLAELIEQVAAMESPSARNEKYLSVLRENLQRTLDVYRKRYES